MILVVDSSALVLLINPAANPPDDPATNQPVTQAQERVEHFLSTLAAADTLIVPTPVLAEALVRAEDGAPGLLAALSDRARIRVKPFGEAAAVETALMTREAIQAGDKRAGSKQAWQKVKVDRQVIAIARVERATSIYADDLGLVAYAKLLGMDVFSTWDLKLPEPETNLFTSGGLEADGRPATESDQSSGGIQSTPSKPGSSSG